MPEVKSDLLTVSAVIGETLLAVAQIRNGGLYSTPLFIIPQGIQLSDSIFKMQNGFFCGYLYILAISPILEGQLEKFIFCSVGLLFTWLMVSLVCEVFQFRNSYLSLFGLNSWASRDLVRKLILNINMYLYIIYNYTYNNLIISKFIYYIYMYV